MRNFNADGVLLEIQSEIKRIEETLPNLRDEFEKAREAEKKEREKLNQAKKDYLQVQRMSGNAANRYQGAKETLANLRRAAEDMISRETEPMDWPVVRSKIHGKHPVK